jgi:hypothetical protein
VESDAAVSGVTVRRCEATGFVAVSSGGNTTLGLDDPGSALGDPGETGVGGACGTVFGTDGLKVGGGGGGTGFTNCAWAGAVAKPEQASHPAMKTVAGATRPNLVARIAVSFGPGFVGSPRDSK